MSNPPESELARPWRRTPLIHSALLSKHAGCQIYLKLENLQPSGSFKSRGVGNFLLAHLAQTAPSQRNAVHFFISSGGNAGLACVNAAITLGSRATIVVPQSTTPYMIAKIRANGATDVIQHGDSWIEADTYLRESIIPQASQKGEDAVYVPPFDAPEIWDGNATLIEEIFEQLGDDNSPPPDAIICSVGGGGLFSGIMQGLDTAGHPDLQVLAVETHGAHSLALSLEKGALSTLPAITSIATSLGARTVASQAFTYAQRDSVRSVVFSDDVAKEGCVRFAEDERIMVETACGVSVALCYEGRLKEVLPWLSERSRVVVTVCGGSNISADMLSQWDAVD